MYDSPNPPKPITREFRTATELRQALADLSAQSQSGSSLGRHAWRSYWADAAPGKLSPWQAFQLGLEVAARLEAPEPPPATNRHQLPIV